MGPVGFGAAWPIGVLAWSLRQLAGWAAGPAACCLYIGQRRKMAGAHSSRQACSPCCVWEPGGTSNRVLEGRSYSSPQSLLYFPLSLIHKHFSHPQVATTAHHSRCFHPAAEIPGAAGRVWQLLSCQRCLCESTCAHTRVELARRVCRSGSGPYSCHV